MNKNWIWVGKFTVVIVVALLLGAILGNLPLFMSATLGTPKLTAGSLVQFISHAGALTLLWLLGQRLAQQLRSAGGLGGQLASPILALATLIVTISTYYVATQFSAPFLGRSVKSSIDWMFIIGILAAAVWLVWMLYENAEAIMEAISKARRPRT